MANFQTHITFGVLTSGVIATTLMAAAVVTPNEAIFLTVAGTVGSVLPDIDLEASRQSRTIFGGFGIFAAFIALFQYSQFLSIAELSLLWLGIYMFVRYFIWRMFNEFTIHRGIFHSLLASLFFGSVGTLIFYYLLDKTDIVAWLGGAVLFIGSITHLFLDEIYSIDFGGNRVKRSFGTAMKLFNYRQPLSALLMVACLAGALYYAPPAGDFYRLVRSPDNWAYLQHRLLPQGEWFDFDFLRSRVAKEEENEPSITGSISDK